jgi:hypothetical protein
MMTGGARAVRSISGLGDMNPRGRVMHAHAAQQKALLALILLLAPSLLVSGSVNAFELL